MVIVIGHVVARSETVEALLEVSLGHVKRSRGEQGCLEHGVHRDAEHPLRLVFVEKWVDLSALQAHFALESSKDFVRRVATLAAQAPALEIFSADPVPVDIGGL
ncbi:MAG: putative quinol monooxygenase [Acidobacteriota bacterium]